MQFHDKFKKKKNNHSTSLGRKEFYKHQFILQSKAKTNQIHGSIQQQVTANILQTKLYTQETKINFYEIIDGDTIVPESMSEICKNILLNIMTFTK